MNGTAPILYVSHDDDDGAWQMLTNDAADMSQAMIVALVQLIERDRTLIELADMPLGWSASREDANSPWIRRAKSDQRSTEVAAFGRNQTFAMTPENYPVVGRFKNETDVAMTLYLEAVPEEVILEPGDEVELLAQPTDNLLPLDVTPVKDGLQIYANNEWDPDWHVRFRGRVIKAGNQTRLSDHR